MRDQLSKRFIDYPLKIVGSNVFGRYPKISTEQTFNMIISDDGLVPYAGYTKKITLSGNLKGRGIFASLNFDIMIVVIGNMAFSVEQNKLNGDLIGRQVGTLETESGDVFIDENNLNQFAISDLRNIYIYNPVASTFTKAKESTTTDLDFTPGGLSFHNGRFLVAALETKTWALSSITDGSLFPNDTQHRGEFEAKPDQPVAVQRFPGRGNLVYVFGSNHIEPWQDVGAQLFPYKRLSSLSIDYGCLNAATIAANDRLIVWLGSNELSGPVIMYSTGGDPQRISTDGIDFKLGQLSQPSDSYGFLFRQDGHLIYQIGFRTDRLSYLYDFTTEKFFTVTDENQQTHIARKIAFFNEKYYFISDTDGSIYEMDSEITTYDGKVIPRIRICSNIRLPNTLRFVSRNLTFTIEQGIRSTNITPRVYLSVSRDGGESFGTAFPKELNPLGKFKNRIDYWNLGAANDLVPQLRFYGFERFVALNGIVSIRT